ncbi:MAG TPA: hypothetical protein VMS11_07195 [Solirubrobacterales bacterium]|nr:hypothetical protein [Solirubrobacterales bacterium]
MALLTIGLGTALAEGEEEGGGPSDPVIVPETEAPPVTNPTTTPSEPSTPVTSSPAPVVKAPESAPTSSGGTRTSTPSTGTRGSSGGSKSTPTQTNSGVTNSGGSGGGGSDRGGSGGSSGGGGSTTSTPTGSSSPATTTTGTTTTERSTSNIEKAAAQLAQGAGHATGTDKKSRQKAVGDLGEALGKALLSDGVSVAAPKHHGDGVADFVPLPGKSKTLYFLLVLVILAIASFVVWTQFRGPRASRRRKAHIDHRVTSAARLTPTERVRARQWSSQQERRARTARRKAA